MDLSKERELVMALANIIKQRRSELGLSLQQVGDRAGISKTQVWELEDGRSKNPTLETIVSIAAALQVSAPELVRRAIS